MIQLANHPKLTLHLITEELKSRKLAGILEQIGVYDCPYLPALNEPIAQCLGLDTDEKFRNFDAVIQSHADRMSRTSNPSETARQVLEELSHCTS